MSRYEPARSAWQDFLTQLTAGAFASLMLSAAVWVIFNIGALSITYMMALGISVLIVFVGVVIIKVSGDGDVSIF